MTSNPRILFDRYPPLMKSFRNGSLSERFEALFWTARRVNVATGYISALSLTQLAKDLERNEKSPDFLLEEFNLVIGMHKFEGMTRAQKEAATSLQSKLQFMEIGNIYIQNTFPFHGKVYCFESTRGVDSIIGSSNISALAKETRQMEVDVELSGEVAQEVVDFIGEMINKTTKIFDHREIKTIEIDNAFMEDLSGVVTVTPGELESSSLWEKTLEYEIPLKCTPKSSLNVSNGRGRVQRNSRIELSRDWFEVEIIVPKSITDVPGYPKYRSFVVVTDDGYKFDCSTGGGNSKNFRSAGSLKTLGRWIKGRMLNAGAISMGELVKPENLARYGRSSITLSKGTESNEWLLGFSVKEV